MGAKRPEVFLDTHAIVLVLGGTLAAAIIAFPMRQFRDLLSFIFEDALFPIKKDFSKTVEHVLWLSAKPDIAAVPDNVRAEFHPFLSEGYAVLNKLEVTGAELKQLLQVRSQRFKERYAWDAKALTALAKFPPAFGLLGATTGMIAMMSNLGASGKETIGPSMAVALVATFWGIGIANFILLPLADHASRLNDEDARLRLMMMNGLLLIHQNAQPRLILEHMVGFLPVSERNNPRFRQIITVAESEMRARGNRGGTATLPQNIDDSTQPVGTVYEQRRKSS